MAPKAMKLMKAMKAKGGTKGGAQGGTMKPMKAVGGKGGAKGKDKDKDMGIKVKDMGKNNNEALCNKSNGKGREDNGRRKSICVNTLSDQKHPGNSMQLINWKSENCQIQLLELLNKAPVQALTHQTLKKEHGLSRCVVCTANAVRTWTQYWSQQGQKPSVRRLFNKARIDFLCLVKSDGARSGSKSAHGILQASNNKQANDKKEKKHRNIKKHQGCMVKAWETAA